MTNKRETLYKFIDFLKNNSDILENQNIDEISLDKFYDYLIELELDDFEYKTGDYLTLDFLDIFEETYLYSIEFFKLGEKQKGYEELYVSYSYLVLNPSDFD